MPGDGKDVWEKGRVESSEGWDSTTQNFIDLGPPGCSAKDWERRAEPFAQVGIYIPTPPDKHGELWQIPVTLEPGSEIKNHNLTPPMQIPSRTNKLEWRLLPNQSQRHPLQISRHTLARLEMEFPRNFPLFSAFLDWFGVFPFPVEMVLPSKQATGFQNCEFYCELNHTA